MVVQRWQQPQGSPVSLDKNTEHRARKSIVFVWPATWLGNWSLALHVIPKPSQEWSLGTARSVSLEHWLSGKASKQSTLRLQCGISESLGPWKQACISPQKIPTFYIALLRMRSPVGRCSYNQLFWQGSGQKSEEWIDQRPVTLQGDLQPTCYLQGDICQVISRLQVVVLIDKMSKWDIHMKLVWVGVLSADLQLLNCLAADLVVLLEINK